MSKATAERWVVASAVIVLFVYAYRSLTEGSTTPKNAKAVAGAGAKVPPLGTFATGWGFAFFIVAMIANAAPALGGSFAILIAVGDLLANAPQLLSDVAKSEKGGNVASTAGAGVKAASSLVTGPSASIAAMPVLASVGPYKVGAALGPGPAPYTGDFGGGGNFGPDFGGGGNFGPTPTPIVGYTFGF